MSATFVSSNYSAVIPACVCLCFGPWRCRPWSCRYLCTEFGPSISPDDTNEELRRKDQNTDKGRD